MRTYFFAIFAAHLTAIAAFTIPPPLHKVDIKACFFESIKNRFIRF